jgi:hypothetical protein
MRRSGGGHAYHLRTIQDTGHSVCTDIYVNQDKRTSRSFLADKHTTDSRRAPQIPIGIGSIRVDGLSSNPLVEGLCRIYLTQGIQVHDQIVVQVILGPEAFVGSYAWAFVGIRRTGTRIVPSVFQVIRSDETSSNVDVDTDPEG